MNAIPETLQTARLIIRPLAADDAPAMQRNSLDEDNRRFVPDEVFETLEQAGQVVRWLMASARTPDGPYVCPVCLHMGEMIGYVQACRIAEGWEAGYHIAKAHTGKGYATEALRAFVPAVLSRLGLREIYGVVLEQNAASQRVLEKCGFSLVFKGEGTYQGEQRAMRSYVYPARK